MFSLRFQLVLPAAALIACAPLAAQDFEALDALIEQTADEEQGIAFANQQTERGELLEALATLERVLTEFPESAEARFNHAMLLCWIDDPQGALVEFERLDEDDYAEGALAQAMEGCASVGEEATEEEEQ